MKHLFTIKNLKPVAFVLMFMAGTAAQAQEVISLERAVQLTLERNLTIKQSQLNEALSNEDYKQSKYNMLPNLNAAPQLSENFGRNIDPSTNLFINQKILALSGNLTAQVVLFQGGQLRNQIVQNRLTLESNRTATAKVKNDLILNVVTDYLQILTNQDLLTAAKQQLDISNLTLERAQKSFNAGNQTLADLSQAKAGVSTADYNITTAQNQLDLSILVLKQYMEMNPATDITIVRPDISKLNEISTVYNAQDVLKTALSVNPDVLLAEVKEKNASQAIKVARGAYYPSIVLFGLAGSNFSDARLQYTTSRSPTLDTIGFVVGTNQRVVTPGVVQSSGKYPFFRQLSDNFNQAVGVSMQIPIFTRFANRTAVRKAKINYEYASVSTQLAKTNLSKIIYQAVWDVQAANKKYLSAMQTYQANKDAYNTIQQRYNVGLVNSLDYNTSLTNYNKAQNDMIQAKYEVIFRSKVIDYYLGNPITL